MTRLAMDMRDPIGVRGVAGVPRKPIRRKDSEKGSEKHWAHWSYAPQCSHIVDLPTERCQPAAMQGEFKSSSQFRHTGNEPLRTAFEFAFPTMWTGTCMLMPIVPNATKETA
ncbi:hypothetical protein GCM10022232_45430 [Streptomyces plumbiresistens]|uniref:Uncharacterized protein n=1 Tax=Streptomyces plumbiresistens TaxID=511811 RepID=A0ABP7RSU6_9ACTN